MVMDDLSEMLTKSYFVGIDPAARFENEAGVLESVWEVRVASHSIQIYRSGMSLR